MISILPSHTQLSTSAKDSSASSKINLAAAMNNPLSKSERELSCEEIKSWKEFYVFVKVLSAYLARNDPTLRKRLNNIVRDCTRRHRDGDPSYSMLLNAIQLRLRNQVDSKSWSKCQSYTARFMSLQQKSSSS